MRALCSSVAALFGLLGFALLVAATGVTEMGDEESSLWLPFGLYFVGVATLLAVVLRRIRA